MSTLHFPKHSKLSVLKCWLRVQMGLQSVHQKSRKNVNWNQKWAKKQLNILRNVMWLYSCGPPKVPTYRTSEKMSEQFFYDGKRILHHTFSHTFYWWTWQRQQKKKSPPNKQFIPHHLSRGKNRTTYKKTRETFFLLLAKAKIIFFRFGLLVSFFCCCVGGQKFQSTWMLRCWNRENRKINRTIT